MFKNWTEICKIEETHMMWAIAMLDLESDMGKKFVRGFPEYFSDVEIDGPYPMSLILEEAHSAGIKDNNPAGECYPVSYYSVPSWIPILTFDIYGDNITKSDDPKLPEDIDPESEQGDVVTWGGKKFVVLENNECCETLELVPLECIALDK